ncbi:MFS transporter [Gryllotalpicola daejeonensis]|uniref:MFS transporter n=1 Tax=Gryllotalpicola daejeonensis TaxID=993087 RepID=A0ABP7ZK10_9MICO
MSEGRRRAGFAVLAVATVALMASASAPSPIYPIYRDRFGFSVAMLTVVFAVYAGTLLIALLTAGSLSDRIGRRPVLIVALLLAAASTAAFWTADGLGALLAARVVQGLASGAAMSALAAALLDFSPTSRPQAGAWVTAIGTGVGMAAGAGGVGLLLEATSRPDRVAFPILTAVFVALACFVLALPETVKPSGFLWAALRPRVSVDPAARSMFWATVPTTIAGWAATGLFLALVPSLVHEVLHVEVAAIGGLSIAALYAAVVAGGLLANRTRIVSVTVAGGGLLGGGALLLAGAVGAASPALFTIGALTLGVGVGLTFNGNLRAVGAVTSSTGRSATFAAVYVVSYVSLSVPVLLAGLAERAWGLALTADAYLTFIALVAVFALTRALTTTRITKEANA